MYLDDIMFSFMFLRFYFLVMAIAAFAPTNRDLFGKRVCHEKEFEPNFTFQVKANMIRYKYFAISIFSILSALFFGCTIRIFERPYYSSLGLLDYSTLNSSLWCVIITMSSVGYGAMYPVTVPGRFLNILCIIVGAFLLSLLVSLIAVGMMLEDNKKEALAEIAEKKRAIRVISTALKYNQTRNLRYN